MDNKKCLIVDDEEVSLELVSGLLSMEAYQCFTASSAEHALTVLSSESFDIMLTDISMGKMNGIELTKKARNLYEDMPIIIMTSFFDEYSYDDAVKAGAADFLKKPFSQKELVARISRVNRDADIISSLKENEKSIKAISMKITTGSHGEAQERLMELEKAMKQLRQTQKLNYL